MVHRIQVDFHKDKRKTRLFLGGNRCIAYDTMISAPNGRKIRAKDIKAGDIVLAVDPDTGMTLPVPVEAVYNNGWQRCYTFNIRCSRTKNWRSIRCTRNHLVLTANGLKAAGDVIPYEELRHCEGLFYSGKYEPMAYLAGLSLPSARRGLTGVEVKLSSRNYRRAVQHCKEHQIDGYLKRRDDGQCTVYGALGEYIGELADDKEMYYSKVGYTWNNRSLEEFLSGLLPQKMQFRAGTFRINVTSATEMRFLIGALKSIGVYATPFLGTQQEDGAIPRLIFLANSFDVMRLTLKLKLPKKLIEDMEKWYKPKVLFSKESNLPVLRIEYFWGPTNTRRYDMLETFDIKLAGGHNLFLADGIIVGNSGKTEGGAVEAIWFATGTHPYRDDIEVPNRGRILCESLDSFEQDILPKLERYAPGFTSWKRIVGHQGKTAGFKLPNGSRIDVFTFDQKSKKLEGTSIRWCWCNEPPPKSHVIASQRGLVDTDGDLWFTLTPLSEPYLHTDFVVPAHSKSKTDIGLHVASIWDNPWLKRESVKKFVESLDPAERAARERGEFLHLMGRVFKEFRTDLHVIPTTDWPKQWPVVIGIDPHLKKDQVAVFLGKTRKGWYVVLNEISYSGGDLEEFGNEIVDAVIKNGYDIQTIVADSFLNQPDMVRRDIEPRKVLDNIFREAGLPNITIAKKKDNKIPSIMEIRRLLRSQLQPHLGNDKDGKPINAPLFYVMDQCLGVIKDFTNYVYRTSRREELTGESEEPIKKWDDFIDATRYALLADPEFITNSRNPIPISIETYTGKQRE